MPRGESMSIARCEHKPGARYETILTPYTIRIQ